MKKQILVSLCYAMFTASIVVAHRSLQSPAMTFSLMNCVLFLSSLAVSVFVCAVVKTAIVLLRVNRYCDEKGVIQVCHSWFLFLHFIYNSPLRSIFPFSLSRISFKIIDDNIHVLCKELTWSGCSERGIFMVDYSPLEGKSGVAAISQGFRSFAGMLLIGMSSAIAAIATCICMSARQNIVTASCEGLVVGIASYLALRLFIVLQNASLDVMVGKYAHARIILWFLIPVFPLGTLFSWRALKLLSAGREGQTRMPLT